jgi:hypothetical protein
MTGPRFDRFAAAMDEARATDAPVTKLYEAAKTPEPDHPAPEPSFRRPTVASEESPQPVHRRGSATLRWLAIASGVALFGILLGHWAVRTNVAETAQLIGARLGMVASQPAAPVEPSADPSAVASPGPDHGAEETPAVAPPATVAPLLSEAALPALVEPPGPAAVATETESPAERPAGFPPLPAFKPPAESL